MFKILKWTVGSALVLAIGGLAVFGTDAFSYAQTAFSSARSHVKEQIPIEFELERAEDTVEAIEPEIRRCERDLAEAEVELRELEASALSLRETIASEEEFVRSRSTVLSSADNHAAEYALASNGRSRVAKLELERVFDSLKNHLEILQAKEARIVQQADMVAAAKETLTRVTAEKAHLEQTIVALRQQKQWLDAMAAESSKFDLDDSQLAKAREALDNVKRRLDVTQQMIQNRTYFDGEAVKTSSDPSRDILGEIEEHFAETAARGSLSPSQGR